MKRAESAKHVVSLLVVLLLTIVSWAAARRANATLLASVASQTQEDEADQQGVTFDNLLAAGSYSLYVEARNIGQQAHSSEITALVEPLKPMLDSMHNEYTLFGDFIAANADTLSRSRVMVAMQPARQSLPPMVIALELASADTAEGFEKKIKEFLGTALQSGINSLVGPIVSPHIIGPPTVTPTGRGLEQILPMKRAGRVLVMSVKSFTFKGLRAQSEKSLSDDPNFRTARDRFYSEALFIYYDAALSARVMKDRPDSPPRPAPPKTAQPGTPLSVNNQTYSIEPESSAPLPSDSEDAASAVTEPSFIEDSGFEDPGQSFGIDSEAPFQTSGQAGSRAPSTPAAASKKKAVAPEKNAAARAAPSSQTKSPSNRPAAAEQRSRPQPVPAQAPPDGAVQERQAVGPGAIAGFLYGLMNGTFSSSAFPEAVAIALTFESDSLAVRLLMINAPGAKMGPIPFLSGLATGLVSGPPHTPEAASYMPSDTDIFVTASLDLYPLYEMGLSMVSAQGERAAPRTPSEKVPPAESGIAAVEKRLGFKINEDLISTLGNEVAVGIPARYLSATPLAGVPLNSQKPQAGPVFLISVRNREALEAKLKPALEAVGLKAPNEKGVSEKFGEIEINSYISCAVAFIDNFLVIGSNAATVRQVLETRAKAQTLMTSRDYHPYMRWQPRETVAQLYVSPAVLKDLFKKPKEVSDHYDEETKQFLAQFSFDPEPITYAATSDPAGPLYEVRIPKNLLIRVFAELSVGEKMARAPRNEAMARSFLYALNEAEKTYRTKHGRFGTLEEIDIGGEKVFSNFFDMNGYKLEFTVSGDRYTATATPVEYGRTGRISLYTDHTGVIREGDHGGRPASAADDPSPAFREQ
jgi:hypothetical protein